MDKTIADRLKEASGHTMHVETVVLLTRVN